MTDFKQGKHLRVDWPETTNGIIQKLENGREVRKTDFFPMTALKALEAKNARLKKTGYAHLAMNITIVEGEGVKAAPAVDTDAMAQEIAELKAKLAAAEKPDEKIPAAEKTPAAKAETENVKL